VESSIQPVALYSQAAAKAKSSRYEVER